MLDIREVRRNTQAVREALGKRNYDFDTQAFENLDTARKRADVESQELQAERKRTSKQVGELIGSGVPVEEARGRVKEQLDAIAARIGSAEEAAKNAQKALDELMETVPNLPDDDVPAGRDEADNVVISHWGEPPGFDFEPADHVDLGAGLHGIDSELGGKLTGSRFTVLSGGVARLHRALIQFMLNFHVEERGCCEVNVPYIVNSDSLRGTGQLPKFAEDLFRLEGDSEYYLIPTAEVPVTNLARERIFEDQELGAQGMRYVCHSPCFRSEAGSYGRDTRGLIRQHQFEKVELVFLTRPAQSDAALETLTEQAEEVLRRLELPFRRVLLCGGDMGFSARKTFDLEVWLPGQGAYREISSCSNFGDYQARRMQARWRNPDSGKPELLHTLNGSALAVGRTLVAVLENYQRADGSVAVPGVLRPYMGGRDVLEPI